MWSEMQVHSQAARPAPGQRHALLGTRLMRRYPELSGRRDTAAPAGQRAGAATNQNSILALISIRRYNKPLPRVVVVSAKARLCAAKVPKPNVG